jgi:hypothetical protein
MSNIQRTNPWKGETSPSSVDTASCYRKFFFSKIVGLDAGNKVALSFGTTLHAGVEACYKTGFNKAEVLKATMLAWKKESCAGDRVRNEATALLLMDNYIKIYKNEKVDLVPGLVECDQWLELGDGQSLLLKIDRVRNDNGYFTVVDTKSTTMALTDYYFRQFENALPVTLYYYAVATILGSCDSVQIDAIRTPPQSNTFEGFVRRSFTRTEGQVKDALVTVKRRLSYIGEVLGTTTKSFGELHEGFFCNHHNCNDYGGCPYLPLCKHGMQHPALQANYTTNNPNGLNLLQLAKEERFNDMKDLKIERQD